MANTIITIPVNPFTPDFDAMVESLIQGYGDAQVASQSTPPKAMTPQTLLGTASTTKAFVALAMAQIFHVEKSPKDTIAISSEKRSSNSAVTWQTPVSTLLPGDFVLPTRELTEAVTIEDILCHRTGLPSCDDACLSWGASTNADTAASVTRKLRNFPLPTNSTLATLRTRYLYSNTMYAAAQHLIETLTNKPLRKILKERIFDILGMQRSFFGFTDLEERGNDLTAEKAKGYRYVSPNATEVTGSTNESKVEFIEVPWKGSPEQGGAGDIISCVDDYALWMRAILSRNPRILSEEGWREIMRPRIVPDDERGEEEKRGWGIGAYALGWFVDSYRGEEIVQHTGGDPGIGTLVHLLPGHSYGISIFANTGDNSWHPESIIAMHLTDNLLKIPNSERTDFLALARDDIARQKQEEASENFTDTCQKLFPETEAGEYPKLGLGITISSCAGSYINPGYGVIELKAMKLGEIRRKREQAPLVAEVDDQQRDILFVDMNDRTFPAELVFLHYNVAFFVIEDWDTLESMVSDWLKGEIRIGVRGDVVAVGIGFETQSGVEELVWFDKIQEGT